MNFSLFQKRKLDHPGVSHLGIDTAQKHAQAFHYSQLYDSNHPIHGEASIESPNALQAQHLSVAAKLGRAEASLRTIP